MSFRHDGKKTKLWRDWLAKHREALAKCGLPDSILKNESTWELFLQEGCVGRDWTSDWNIGMLSIEQKKNLRAFLEQEDAGDAHPRERMMKDLRRQIEQEIGRRE
jgi:hypothetical protein